MRIVCVVLLLAASLLAESVAGLKWTAPSGWKSEGAKPMRAATYVIPPANGDAVGTECAIYYFGPGQGGSVEANLQRWKGQMSGADGKPANAKIAKQTIHDLPVTTIDTSGDYAGMGGPLAASKSVAKTIACWARSSRVLRGMSSSSLPARQRLSRPTSISLSNC